MVESSCAVIICIIFRWRTRGKINSNPMNSIQEDPNKLWELEGKLSWETWLKQKEFSRVGTSLKKLFRVQTQTILHSRRIRSIVRDQLCYLAKQHGLQ